jgi:GNAT superfamily N-acetyltransferase
MQEELEIRELDYAEIPQALRLSTQAGWNQVHEDWWRLVMVERDCCFAGKVGGKFVATGTLAPYRNKCGWVGMILVDEAYRKRGYGEAMLNRVLRTADEMGLEWVGLDATEMGKPLYLKKGFRVVGGIDRWRLATPHQPIMMHEVREAMDFSEEFWMQKMDLVASGMDRWKLFLDLESGKGIEKVVCQKNGLLGFGISRPGRLGPYIGPVVAASEEIAAGIVSRLLERFNVSEKTPVFIDVPRKTRIEAWLIDEGFEVIRSWTRMIRGPTETAKSELYFAIAGPELG